jgi:energy-coupling factor transporter ATP-binding protein EcfA2
VTVLGIHSTTNVNSLAPGEHLTFAENGLTIVYGDNGSGKSGYARILKAVTRTRASERVHNDIFKDPSLIPAATIDFAVAGAARSFDWSPATVGSDPLSQASFFDRSCSGIYLSRDTEVAFRPFGLGLFDELVDVCERVRTELDRRATDAGRRTPGLPALDDTTQAGTFLKGLSAATKDADIAGECVFSSESQERLDLLTQAEALARQGTTRAEAQRLQRLASRVERLKESLTTVTASISQHTLETLIKLRDADRTAATAARIAREQAMQDVTLDGVGEAVWRNLWEAARTYSDNVAYPEQSFPVVEDASCVLCQQPLTADASERLTRFEAFVRDTTQEAARTATAAFVAARDALTRIIIIDNSLSDVIDDLRNEDADLGTAIDEYREQAEALLSVLKSIGTDDERAWDSAFPVLPADSLDVVIAALKNRSEELDSTISTEGAAQLAAELAELRARKALSNAVDTVTAERDRLQLVGAITTAKSEASTNAITAKGSELTKATLTEVLIDGFSRETDRLGVERVVLREVGGRRGVLRCRAGFIGAERDVPMPEVLSEGEQTALGMAGFLAEVRTDPSKSALIFDDPVSSLDHERRDKVAKTLVTLASERQTIVFTHDLAFVLALKKHAVHDSVKVTERSIERLNRIPGHCDNDHKFSAKLVRERLQELDGALASLRGGRDSMADSEYRDASSKWYRLLRRTWERAIEENLVGGVLTRDDFQVHPTMVRTLILFTAEDNKELQYGYGRATECSESHDESAAINSPAPTLDEMAGDLESIRTWSKRLTTRQSLSEETIYDMTASQ